MGHEELEAKTSRMSNYLPLHCLLHGGMRTRVSREARNHLLWNVLYVDSKKVRPYADQYGISFPVFEHYHLPSPQMKCNHQKNTTNHLNMENLQVFPNCNGLEQSFLIGSQTYYSFPPPKESSSVAISILNLLLLKVLLFWENAWTFSGVMVRQEGLDNIL